MGTVTQFRRQGFRETTSGQYYGWALKRVLLGRKPRRTWRAIWLLCASLGVAWALVEVL